LAIAATLALRLKGSDVGCRLVLRQVVGNVSANVVDASFQCVVEQIADHRHAALHPLPASTELGVVELGHRSVTVLDGNEHVRDRVGRDAVTLAELLDELLASGSKLGHVLFGGLGDSAFGLINLSLWSRPVDYDSRDYRNR